MAACAVHAHTRRETTPGAGALATSCLRPLKRPSRCHARIWRATDRMRPTSWIRGHTGCCQQACHGAQHEARPPGCACRTSQRRAVDAQAPLSMTDQARRARPRRPRPPRTELGEKAASSQGGPPPSPAVAANTHRDWIGCAARHDPP